MYISLNNVLLVLPVYQLYINRNICIILTCFFHSTFCFLQFIHWKFIVSLCLFIASLYSVACIYCSVVTILHLMDSPIISVLFCYEWCCQKYFCTYILLHMCNIYLLGVELLGWMIIVCLTLPGNAYLWLKAFESICTPPVMNENYCLPCILADPLSYFTFNICQSGWCNKCYIIVF